MKITKEKLISICKIINIPTIGTKNVLEQRICNTICNENEKSKPKSITLIELLKNKDKAITVVNDIKEMMEDDSSDSSIAKSLSNLHHIKLTTQNAYFIIEILDAANKHDYTYIEDKIQEWGTKAKIAIALAKIYAESNNNKSLLNSLE